MKEIWLIQVRIEEIGGTGPQRERNDLQNVMILKEELEILADLLRLDVEDSVVGLRELRLVRDEGVENFHLVIHLVDPLAVLYDLEKP